MKGVGFRGARTDGMGTGSRNDELPILGVSDSRLLWCVLYGSCICARVHVCVCVHVCARTCVRVYICVHVHVCVCAREGLCVRECVLQIARTNNEIVRGILLKITIIMFLYSGDL